MSVPRLKQLHTDEIAPQLQEELGLDNVMQIPTLDKIVVNMGLGDAIVDKKAVEQASDELSLITGQRPRVNRARKSIANFKLREGMPIGVSVTLRGPRMWEFFDRHPASLRLPRSQPQSFRWPRELQRRCIRAVDLPGDRFRLGDHHSRHEHHHRHDRRQRRARQSPARCLRFPIPQGTGRSRRELMAKKSLVAKANRKPKFKVRAYNRCQRCGRPRAYLRDFGMCRICVRELASKGELPGVRKASW